MNKPICNDCEKLGVKYAVYEYEPGYAVIDSGRTEAFWDENGKYHSSASWWTKYYRCSNGHHFSKLINLPNYNNDYF